MFRGPCQVSEESGKWVAQCKQDGVTENPPDILKLIKTQYVRIVRQQNIYTMLHCQNASERQCMHLELRIRKSIRFFTYECTIPTE